MLRILSDRPVYLVIDALDECPASGTHSPRDAMLALIQYLVGLNRPKVHICVTSRPEHDIKAAIESLDHQSIMLDAEGGQARQIRQFVCSFVDGFTAWREEDRAYAIEILCAKANGM